VTAEELARTLPATGLLERDALGETKTICLALPGDASGPVPSDRLRGAVEAVDRPTELRLHRCEVPTLELLNEHALSAVLQLEDRGPTGGVEFGHSLPYWIAVARFVVELLADQRFIPTLVHPRGGGLQAAWRPWLHDGSAQARLGALLAAMPPIVRAAGDSGADRPWRILQEAVEVLSEATVRLALIREEFHKAIENRDPSSDPHVAWLEGLLGRRVAVRPGQERDAPAADMLRVVRAWISQLEDAGRLRPVSLCFRLEEPPRSMDLDNRPPADELACWRLGLQLRLEGEPPVTVDAERVWAASQGTQLIDGHRIDRPQELLLAELGRASRIYPKVESALSEAHPAGLDLTTAEAAGFLRDYRPVLEESGFGVMVPEWWDQPTSRLGVRLQIDSGGGDAADGEAGAPQGLGLQSPVRYRWRIAVGDQPLSTDELRDLARRGYPLVRIGQRWVEISPPDIAAATDLVQADPGGEVSLLEAVRMAQNAEVGVPILGLDASGWVSRILDADDGHESLPRLSQPRGFTGTLRPYQRIGLSWLAFLERFGLGACLADDMGLGKTIQLIALLLDERERRPRGAEVGPTLLIVPTSLISNWTRELDRFAPSLSHHVHHGPQRRVGTDFVETVAAADVVITTYALVPRDLDTLVEISWRRVVLDEAQYIKNPPTKQTTSIRKLPTQRRVALTGTPVENRLSELWSIMEFCNPGYLGPAEAFRRRCAVPIERHRDHRQAESLRNLVRPFVLRRLKTDPRVIVDLPACVETKEYATLTAEQAALYQAIVDQLLAVIDRAEGIQRRGRVLATLTRLKQVCNHPAHLPPESGFSVDPTGDHRPLSSRSGKCRRLCDMLEELLAAGDQALVFTQYRRMGDLLAAMIRHDLDCEIQFMHGGTPPPKRQEMIDRFQRGDGTAPVFILSLKAGGVGLNLTAANHVFHFDRWWNPAVENQATDRAFRIGQTRTVHVHKFVCVGTLEERIDQMIEQKTELAENIISSGEQWVTELSTERLRDVLKLREEAMEVES
jgi:SNF2 family DNA or RNA helicase